MPCHHEPFAPSSEQLDDWRMELTSDMAEVKTLLKTLVGNGQPGVIARMDERTADLDVRTTSLERSRNQLAGAIAIVSGMGAWFLHHLFGGSH